MARYTITTRGGRCTATDTTNGVRLDWLAGAYDDTAEVEADTQGADLSTVWRSLYEYVALTRPELL